MSQIVAGRIRYRIVPEARFLRNDECFAKHGSHYNAAWINAFYDYWEFGREDVSGMGIQAFRVHVVA